MKKYALAAALLYAGCFAVSAQELSKFESLKAQNYTGPITANSDGIIYPLSDGAFSKYLTNHYSYTILGDASPSTGIKVNTTSPSVSLKSPVFKSVSSSFLATLELSAGTDAKLFEVFSANKLSGSFKATLGLNHLLWKNSANFNDENNNYTRGNLRGAAIVQYDLMLKRARMNKVVQAIISDEVIEDPKKSTLIKTVNDGNTNSVVDFAITETLQSLGLDATKTGDVAISLIASYWKDFTQGSDKKLVFVKELEKMTLFNENLTDSIYRFEVKNAEKLYSRRVIWWVNVSPFINNVNFKQFNVASASFDKNSSLLWGSKFTLNSYFKYKEPHKFLYGALSFSQQKMNTLDDMTKYTYGESTVLKAANTALPGDNSLSKEDTGTAYDGDFDSGWGQSYEAEGYTQFFTKAYMPGFFVKGAYSNTIHRLNRDKLSIYGGLLWNITNSDKTEKNLLTIMPYAGWTNVIGQYKDKTKAEVLPLHDLFTAGVQIGIPINISK